jgi:hypothetical protein
MDLVYGHPLTYRLIEKLIYGRSYRSHYEALAREIGSADLLELCCGDCQIVDFYRGASYRGIDINPVFVRHARARGLNVVRGDLTTDPIPEAGCILIHNSLYQFYPGHEALVRRALASARDTVIISEPVVNLSSSPNPFVAAVARKLTSMGGAVSTKRFSRPEIEELFRRFGAVRTEFLGRNLMGVISARSSQ